MDQSPQRGDACRINEKPCATCPFVDASRRKLDFVEPAEAADLVAKAKTTDRFTPNVCHASVYGMHGIKGGASVCRGFIEANPMHPFVMHNKYAYPKPAIIDVPVPHPASP